jgi:hypothetical protein
MPSANGSVMRSRYLASGLFVATAALVVMSGCATGNRVKAEYFEPSGGDAKIISVPASGPPNAALVQYGPNTSLTIRASVNQGVASVNMVLVVGAGAKPMTFTGRRVVFEVGGTRDEREAMWDASLIDNKRPRTERLAFNAELKPADVPVASGEGITNVGLYQCSVVVPLPFQTATEFRLTVPAVTGGAPLTLNFTRRTGGTLPAIRPL